MVHSHQYNSFISSCCDSALCKWSLNYSVQWNYMRSFFARRSMWFSSKILLKLPATWSNISWNAWLILSIIFRISLKPATKILEKAISTPSCGSYNTNIGISPLTRKIFQVNQTIIDQTAHSILKILPPVTSAMIWDF